MTRAKSDDTVLIQYTGRLEDNSVTLDANHVLVGKDLTFDVRFMKIA
ncbi:MAG: hypothetical protein ISS79_05545 [Phycisphaerae bacterium]|nr:hypothetical protein [Phycisphaerae bacterium]